MKMFSPPPHARGFLRFTLPFLVAWMIALALFAETNWTSKPIEEVRKGAEKGDPFAQRVLANAYLNGEGVPKDTAEALKLLHSSAEKKDIYSQYALGVIYDDGKIVPQDRKEAFRWYQLAAEQGLPEAQFNVGVCYAKGEGVEPDATKAVEWYRKAAKQRDVQAQTQLALALKEGKGVTKDAFEASQWLRLAAYEGDAQAQFVLGKMYLDGEGVAKDKAEAVPLLLKAASQGNRDAAYHLGKTYLEGGGIPKNIPMGLEWLKKAADQGQAYAMFDLGQMHLFGEGIPANPTEAVKLFTKAKELGHPQAAAQLELATKETNLPKSIPSVAPAANEPKEAVTAKHDAETTRKEVKVPSDPTPADPLPLEKSGEVAVVKSAPTKELEPSPTLMHSEPAPASSRKPEFAAATSSTPNVPTPVAQASSTTPVVAAAPLAIPGLMVLILSVATAVMAIFCILILLFFRERLGSLEREIKETKMELAKANVSLATMVHHIESRALPVKSAEAPLLPPGATGAVVGSAQSLKLRAPRSKPAA